MKGELVALLGGREVGRVQQDARSRLTFVYDQSWREAEGAYPMSLSMPLAAQEHGSAVAEAFLWGLLPDNEFVLERWAKRFQVSARNVFALLSHVGEDCAGAIQFVTPGRLEAIQSGKDDKVEWLSEHDIADRLRILREDNAAWRLARDTGQFSLAGAQPKTALLFENDKWGVPSGRIPTTHILKPPTGHFEGHAENEYLCLELARAFDLPTATARVAKFEKETAIVIERYDRERRGNDIIRVHQEDTCQALGVMPTRKYENEGGPSVPAIIDLLRTHSSGREEDVDTFIDAIGLNWLIAGTDAHAKNYSLLISGGSRVRLAPLYDIASILPYDNIDFHKVKLAMKIGGEYKLRNIIGRHWFKFAREVRVDFDLIIANLTNMTRRMPDEVLAALKRAKADGLTASILDRLSKLLIDRANECLKMLAAASGGA